MIYIAESGSTKCDAVFLNDDGTEVCRIQTIGFNPYFHDSDFITKELTKVDEIKELGAQVSQVFFFGAGCSSAELNQKVVNGLAPHFPNAKINVDHDLMACAYATYNGEPEISCILGTGSNTVFFDGNSITKGVSGLGYILGDEGSASYIGKKVLAAYLYETMPSEFIHDFDETYKLTRDQIRERVYEHPHANVFIGSFAPFANKHISDPFFEEIVYDGFRSFFEVQVKYFPQAMHVPVNFVGSIAYHFQPTLEQAAVDAGLKMGKVVRRPIDGLLRYYMKHILKIEVPTPPNTIS